MRREIVRVYVSFLPLAIFFLVCSCELDNAIFPRTSLITETSSDASTQPNFVWRATGRRIVFLGVFSDRISVSSWTGKISNTDDCVWAWFSVLGTGREGQVAYNDGVDVVQGDLQTGKTPTPLQSGSVYYWAVWAWDDAGKKIVESSEEMALTVP